MTSETQKLDDPLIANSFEELYEKVRKAQEILGAKAKEILGERGGTHEDQREESPVEIWYRGVPKKEYPLLPSLLRFPNGPRYERQLYTQFIEHRVPEKRNWHALYEMQHYFIPTRLLDWTTSFGVALHFALNSDEALDNPIIWVLHPGILNHKALPQKEVSLLFTAGQARSLSTDDLKSIDLNYFEHYVEDSLKDPQLPLCITPEAELPRLRAQRGRFTVHGSEISPLEALCPEAVQRIVIRNTAFRKIKARILLTGIDAFSIFPDAVGLANFLRQRYGLSNKARTKTLIDKLGRLWQRDIKTLREASGQPGVSTPEVSIRGIENCVVSEDYLNRTDDEEGVNRKLKAWVDGGEGGIYVVTGNAGSGKTNCLLNLVIRQELYKNRAVIWFPLFRFEPKQGLLQNLDTYLHDILDEPVADLNLALSELLRNSDTILILDGLDELSRTKGRGAAKTLVEILKRELLLEQDDDEKPPEKKERELRLKEDDDKKPPEKKERYLDLPKVLISCRSDIYSSLGETLELREDPLAIKPLSKKAIERKLRRGKLAKEVLTFLAEYPIFLRYLHDPSRPKSIPTQSSRFFEALMPIEGPGKEENLRALGKIACEMLSGRRDFLKSDDFKKFVTRENIASDHFFQPKPFFLQALLKEKNGDVRFLHHTIREFILAWNVHDSLTLQTTNGWDLLTETRNLDYEGAEVHRAVAELKRDPDWRAVKHKWNNLDGWTKKNNFAWCCFEAAGMLGVQGRQRKTVLDWIRVVLKRRLNGRDRAYSFYAKYNAVRCLERLHPSAPPCYWEWVMGHRGTLAVGWKGHPDDHRISGYAVRGFQRSELGVAKHPGLLMHDQGKRGGAPHDLRQREFSEILVKGIEFLTSFKEISKYQSFVLINMTYALIRWYSKAHKARVRKILDNPDLDRRAKANLRLALWCWHPKFQDSHIIKKKDKFTYEPWP